MPQAGQVIRAIDFSPLAEGTVQDQFENFTTTGFEPTTPALEVTFIAPTSGNVFIDMQISLDSDSVDETLQADVEIRVTDGAGALVHSPTVSDGQGVAWIRTDGTAFETKFGYRIQTGLIAGQTYWAQMQLNTGGTDLRDQLLAVLGIP